MQQHDEYTQEKNAATALFDRFVSCIFAYARLYTPSWEDARDVTQEVFSVTLEQENLSLLSGRQQFAWLM